MQDPRAQLRPPVSAVAVSVWAVVAAAWGIVGAPLVAWAHQMVSPDSIEGMVVFAPVFMSWWFSVPAIVGGAVCLSFAGRAYSARGRATAYTLSGIALAVGVVILAASWLVLVAPAPAGTP